MASLTVTIRHESGLHARPAALFVETSSRFKSRIQVIYGKKQVNAKSILGVLALGAHQDAALTIQADGDDADRALQALKALIDSNFGAEV